MSGKVELVYCLDGNAYYEFDLRTSKKSHKRRTGDGAIDRHRRHNDAKNIPFWDCEQPRYLRPVKYGRSGGLEFFREDDWRLSLDMGSSNASDDFADADFIRVKKTKKSAPKAHRRDWWCIVTVNHDEEHTWFHESYSSDYGTVIKAESDSVVKWVEWGGSDRDGNLITILKQRTTIVIYVGKDKKLPKKLTKEEIQAEVDKIVW